MALAVCVALPSAASAESMTLEQLLQRIESDPVLTAGIDARAAEIESNAEASARPPGPQVGTNLRWLVGVEQEVEVEFGQAFPLDGVRPRTRQAGAQRAAAMRAADESSLLERKADAADQFFTVVFLRQRIEILETRRTAVERARASLAKREEAGDVSAFELERMEREVRRSDIGIRRAAADAKMALERLAALVGVRGLDGVTGSLRPETCGGERREMPAVRALIEQIEASELDREIAKRAWIPALQTRVGWVGMAEGGEFATGVFGGLGLGFPFWKYGDYARDAASARIVALNTEKKVLHRTTDILADAYAERCSTLLDLAGDADRSVDASQRLLERAEAGYAAAELSLLELVDAQSALLEDRLEHLSLVGAARQAQNDWMRVTGGWQ